MLTMDIIDGSVDAAPKRGDLLYTNVGDKRERTWFILHARKITRRNPDAPRRYQLHTARWWELEPEMRVALWRLAERNGGQGVWWFRRYPAKSRKRSFESLMRG